jgi:hypothetical protein
MISACPFALTPELIIAIATAALAIATFVLAGVTAWMARETRTTAETATKTLALEQMPILGVRNLRVEITRYGGDAQPPPAISAIRVGIELFNAGRVPVKYQVTSFAISLADQYIKIGDFGGGRVLPGASSMSWRPQWDFIPPIVTFPANGEVSFEYEYSDELSGKPRATDILRRFTNHLLSVVNTALAYIEFFRSLRHASLNFLQICRRL